MCDDQTESDNERFLERKLGRRDLGLLGLGAAAVAAAPGCSSDGASATAQGPDGAQPSSTSAATASAPAGTATPTASASVPAGAPTTSRRVTIKTADGTCDAFFVAPSEGKHPAVIVWPDVAGLREAYETMGTRLAGAGYAVLVVNQYYRTGPAPLLASFAEWRTDEGKAKLKPAQEKLSSDGTTRDAAAFVAWLDTQPEVDTKKKIGSAGYCQGGPSTIRTAAAAPTRVGAAASFHGGNLATDKPDSPHLLLAKTQASFLIAIAQNDDEKQPDAKTKLREAADGAKRPAEIEVYPAQHGWCTIDSPVFDQAQGDRAWARMLATFQAAL